ncbi:MAG: MBL fold metallo-hydrolase [Armatimonadota bacterium]|nr:MBL fold metallo-hydrolase [Armatimonadota bacterium]MDR5696421.1 MBL fold metallo-hydrolase [Armatimonadota bacterium]
MADVIELTGGSGYLPGAVNVGVVATADGGAVLIDTGADADYGRTIRKALAARGLTLRAIVNTHSHADHYGGNDYLVRNLGAPVWAPAVEEAILRYPYLEPAYLMSGASPMPEMLNKWLMAKPSPVDHVYETTDGELHVAGVGLAVHRADGHAIRQAAIGCGAVCYAADAFFGPEVLDKYQIPFAHDVAGQIATLARLPGWDYAWFVPGHGEPVPREEIEGVAARNLAAVRRASDIVREALGGTTSEVVHAVTARLKTPPTNLSTYVLMHATVLAHLVHLAREGAAEALVESGKLIWRKR